MTTAAPIRTPSVTVSPTHRLLAGTTSPRPSMPFGLSSGHSPDAPIHAAMRADAMLEKGDLEGYAVWRWVLRAVGKLLSEERPTGASVQ